MIIIKLGDNMTIGIPRSLYYYYYGEFWKNFFNELNVSYVVSPKTNRKIMDLGMKYANDEMCLSLKNYIGHVSYLQDKCDMILVPRIDNYGRNNQTCTNFLATYDIIHNLFPKPLLTYNIDYENGKTERKEFYRLGKLLNKKKAEIDSAYQKAMEKTKLENYRKIRKNILNLKEENLKVLIVGHPYNIYDSLLGEFIIKGLESQGVTLVYSNLFLEEDTQKLSKRLSDTLYFKYSKENIGAIELCKEKIQGIVFVSSFPCGPDSLVNELVMRKINLPYLNLVIDDLDGGAGVETRIESFIDILKERQKCQN